MEGCFCTAPHHAATGGLHEAWCGRNAFAELDGAASGANRVTMSLRRHNQAHSEGAGSLELMRCERTGLITCCSHLQMQ